jgi:membrane protease YdiL (CAAX protease family)
MPDCSTREILRFVALAYLLGFAVQLLALRAGITEGGGGGGWLNIVMWTPAVAAFASGRGPRALALRSLRRLGARDLALGFVVGGAPELLSCVLSFAAGSGRWNRDNFELDAAKTHVTLHKVGTIFGAINPENLPLFAANVVLSVALSSLVGAVVAGIGEEIGWRGVLQPALERRFGFVRGTTLVGLVWAYWHLLGNLAGYNDARHPIVTSLLLFPLLVVGLAFLFGWLFRRTGSVWPCAVAHMAYNSWSTVPLVKTPDWIASNLWGLVAAAALVGGVLLLDRRRSQRICLA